jgi:hypothetical protein
MPQPLTLPLPPNIDLWDSCIIRVTAISATTGAVVPGVNVTEVSLDVTQVGGAPLNSGPYMLVPGPNA